MSKAQENIDEIDELEPITEEVEEVGDEETIGQKLDKFILTHHAASKAFVSLFESILGSKK